ncbi:hypothetical protein [Halorussus salinisoli]|uniref:hypothetical protein n=1 Tax=Halorussus salinisoli TaxID=2558242 RepID=UPI0010C160DB|nr:hypothetical protein [Halorussus salinisoli]
MVIQMAPFEWLTPERVMKSLGLFASFGLLGVGVLNIYLGLVTSTDFVLFGVDALLMAGGLQVIAGIFFLINEHMFRPRVPSRNRSN